MRRHRLLMHLAAWLMAALCIPANAHALATPLSPATGPIAPHDEALLDEQVNRLSGELRCLVCQNQTIAESSAPLARQLKAEVRSQLAGGASEQQVRDFMAQRYGDFVLYRPPVTQLTWLLWGGPLLLLMLGALLLSQRRAALGQGTAHDADDTDEDW